LTRFGIRGILSKRRLEGRTMTDLQALWVITGLGLFLLILIPIAYWYLTKDHGRWMK